MGANIGFSFGTGQQYRKIANLLNNASDAQRAEFVSAIRRGKDVLDAHLAVFDGGVDAETKKLHQEFDLIDQNWFGDEPMWFGNSVLTPGQIHEVMCESRARTVELLLRGAGPLTIYIGCGYPQLQTIITWDGATRGDEELTIGDEWWRPRNPTGEVTMWVLAPFNSGYLELDPARRTLPSTEVAAAQRLRDALITRVERELGLPPGTPAASVASDPDLERRRRELLDDIPVRDLARISRAYLPTEHPWRGTILGAVGDGIRRPGRDGLQITFHEHVATPPPLPPGTPAEYVYDMHNRIPERWGPGISITWGQPAPAAPQRGRASEAGGHSRHPSPLRGLRYVRASRSYDGLYGRMFGRLTPTPLTDDETAALFDEFEELAGRMAADDTDTPAGVLDAGDNPDVPAITTYLGQFIDHDLTFDPVSSLQRAADPDALIDFRTPRFDLDSLYGSGPDDQPYLYDAHGRFVFGPNKTFDLRVRPDLPRTRDIALIGDKRNDENLIISQLHVIFQRFHNAVIDGVDQGGARRTFEEAQRVVRWHYQWIVVNDFLPKVICPHILARLRGSSDHLVPQGLQDRLEHYRPRGPWGAYMPVEFSVAAFRFGHSMVRASYLINDVVPPSAGRTRIPVFDVPRAAARRDDLSSLRGFGEIPDAWAIDWRFFVDGLGDGRVGLPQRSRLIDTKLADPLARLQVVGVVDGPPESLAERNLKRGARFDLPSGQAIARYLGIQPLGTSELGLDDLPLCAASCPLWYYVLREAEVVAGGKHLGPVGSTIVAEVILGLLAHDQFSYLDVDRTWTPHLTGTGTFSMADLVRLAESWSPVEQP